MSYGRILSLMIQKEIVCLPHTGATMSHTAIFIPSVKDFHIGAFRKSLGLTQSQFAKRYCISLGTLKKQERGNNNSILNAALREIIDDWISHEIQVVT